MRVVGRAHTVLTADVYERPADPYRLEIEAVDALEPGDVMVACTNGSERTCFWGELLSTAARYRGCRGVVLDGYTRDAQAIIAMGFPCFTRGIHVADSLGRLEVVRYDVPIECGGVRVEPGDLVFGDYDGIVVIPRAVAPEVIARAEEKVRGENLVRRHLAEGMPVKEAFRRFGIL
jgi:regulator of RNase E activity RraA